MGKTKQELDAMEELAQTIPRASLNSANISEDMPKVYCPKDAGASVVRRVMDFWKKMLAGR